MIEEYTSNSQACPADVVSGHPAGEDYVAKNKQKTLLEAGRISIGRPVQLISQAELDKTFSSGPDEGWTLFHKNHPGFGGMMILSAIGFNSEQNVALVTSGFQAAPLYGEGRLHTLEKKNGLWQETSGPGCRWIS